ncbi:MAG: MFS transporter [Candidatus Thorarchaeota archaeon]
MANVTRNVGYAERVRLFKKDAMLFIASSSMGAFAYGTSNVVFNLYMVESGFGEDFLGFFLSVSMFGTAAIAIIAGILTDRRSRKNMVLASSLISVLAIFVQYTTLDPIGLILSQIFLGLSSAFNQVAWSPYITDLSTDEERAHLFGVNGGVSLLAVLGGNLLGGFIPGLLQNTLGIAVDLFWAYRFTLWLSLIPMALSAILVLPMTKDKPRESEDSFGLGNVKNWGFIGKYATSVSTVGLGAGMIVLFFNLFFEVEFTADASLIGVIFGINTVVLASGNFLAPALSDRLGKVRTVVLTEALSIPFLLMISWAPYLYLAVIAYVMRTVLMNMAGPVSHAFFMEKLAKEERATAMGIVRTGDSIVRGIAANIGGFLLAAGFYRLPYLLVSGLYVVGVVLFFVFFRSMDVDEPLDAT